MTIEEWLDKRIENAREDCLNQDIETYEDGYAEGYKDALQLVRDKLPFLDHEVTLREVKEECQKHDDEDGCSGCVLLYKLIFSGIRDCGVSLMPSGWDIDEIQKKVKEMKNDD